MNGQGPQQPGGPPREDDNAPSAPMAPSAPPMLGSSSAPMNSPAPVQANYPGIVYSSQSPATYNIPGGPQKLATSTSAGHGGYYGSIAGNVMQAPYPPSGGQFRPPLVQGGSPSPYPVDGPRVSSYPSSPQNHSLGKSSSYSGQGGYPGQPQAPEGANMQQTAPRPQHPGQMASPYPSQQGPQYPIAPSPTYPPMQTSAYGPPKASPYPTNQGAPTSFPQVSPYQSAQGFPRPGVGNPTGGGGYTGPSPAGQPYPAVSSSPHPSQAQGGYGRQQGHQAAAAEQIRQRQLTTDALRSMNIGGTRGARKALVIGCNYQRTSAELKGCINDAKCMQYLLASRFGFEESHIRLMTDDQAGRYRPTKQNILEGMRWLVEGAQPGTSLFFHFSGHGSQKRDYTGDEKDGFNETLLPTDHKTAGHIVDDDVNRFLVNVLGPGVVLHAVIDACHSGTAMDLQYYTKFKNGSWSWKDNGPTRKYKGTNGGVAFQFGACKDSEVAQDTNDLSGNVHTGAATYCFIDAIEKGGTHQSYGDVLSHMHRSLERLNSGSDSGSGVFSGGVSGAVLGLLMNGAAKVMGVGKQTPMLSCTEKYDVTKPLRL